MFFLEEETHHPSASPEAEGFVSSKGRDQSRDVDLVWGFGISSRALVASAVFSHKHKWECVALLRYPLGNCVFRKTQVSRGTSAPADFRRHAGHRYVFSCPHLLDSTLPAPKVLTFSAGWHEGDVWVHTRELRPLQP